MNKNNLTKCVNDEDLSESQKTLLIKIWDTLLLWSGTDGVFYTIKELASILKVRPATINYRIKKFREAFPEAFKTLQAGRVACKRTTTRLSKSLRNPLSWEHLRENLGTEPEKWIKEKF